MQVIPHDNMNTLSSITPAISEETLVEVDKSI